MDAYTTEGGKKIKGLGKPSGNPTLLGTARSKQANTVTKPNSLSTSSVELCFFTSTWMQISVKM